jgi:hypothetical protein
LTDAPDAKTESDIKGIVTNTTFCKLMGDYTRGLGRSKWDNGDGADFLEGHNWL